MVIQDSGVSAGISALVEKQMRNWGLANEQQKRGAKSIGTTEDLKFYLAISRECGCDGEQIADAIAKRTGFQKFDQEILNYMVKREDVRRKLYETIDDRTMTWIEKIVSSLVPGPGVDQMEYFNRLSHALLAICHNTHAIIIGRGANFILPRERGLAVRMVAPQNYRLERYAKRYGIDLKTAMREMERIDYGRGQFIETHFGRFAFDPRRYDLVINVSQFTEEQIVDQVLLALRAKGGKGLKLPVKVDR